MPIKIATSPTEPEHVSTPGLVSKKFRTENEGDIEFADLLLDSTIGD